MNSGIGSSNIVLLGLGHTHAHVVKEWSQHPIPEYQLVAISDFRMATYSGMLPGVLAGDYRPDQLQIDLARLCQVAGVRLVQESLESIDRERKVIKFQSGRQLDYAILSVAVGSRPPVLSGIESASPEQQSRVVSIKPMQTLLERLDVGIGAAIAHSKQQSQTTIQIDVVGGGLGSLEIAMCLPGWLNRFGLTTEDYRLRVISGSDNPPEGCLNSTRRKIQTTLRDRGVELRTGVYAQGWANGHLVLDDGTALDSHLVVYVGAGNASAVTEKLGLPLDSRGCVITHDDLRSIEDSSIWAAGDCGSILGKTVPKAGVYAVRQGPVVWKNLIRWSRQQPVEDYHPQHDFLKLINAGDGSGIGQWKWFSFRGKWVWRWKDHIDRNFMEMYQKLAAGGMSEGKAANDQKSMQPMRCLGCGGKVGGTILRQALSQVLSEQEAGPDGFRVLTATDLADDVAVVSLDSADKGLAVTVDSMAAPIDDPFQFGRISVVHALSDLWVSGVRPLGVTLSVELPYDAEPAVLRELMSGVITQLQTHRVRLLGGHTLEGPRLAVSVSGFGTVDGSEVPLKKQGLEPGDVLLYTKQLGTGIVLAAEMKGLAEPASMHAALEAMLMPNDVALELQGVPGIHAATDVTGFGVAGHLHEMLASQNHTIEIDTKSVDAHLLPGLVDLIERGVESTLAPSNREYLAGVDLASISGVGRAVLVDPQTSGGLLVATAADHANAVVELLKRHGQDGWVLGRVSAGQPKGWLTAS